MKATTRLAMILLGVSTFAASGAEPKWIPFDFRTHGATCDGKVETQLAKVELPPMGDVKGAPHNPKCGEPKEERFEISYREDDEGNGSWGVSYNPGDPKAICKDLVVVVPPNARLCELRFFASEADGKGWTEEKALRNKPRHRGFSWARKGRTMARVLSNGTLELKAEVKNWKRSDPRYFGFEVDIQRAEKPVR